MVLIEDEGERLIQELCSLGGSQKKFVTDVANLISDSIHYVLDGCQSLDELEACEKTYVGTKFEKRFLKHFGLLSKHAGEKQHLLDTVIAGIDVDLKFTLGGNWMIPPEAVNQWCLLIQADVPNSRCSVGLLKMVEENLTKGGNRDRKRSVSKAGRDRIIWIGQDEKLPQTVMRPRPEFHGLLHEESSRLFSRSPIILDEVTKAPRTSGVYAIFYEGMLAYVGKTVDLRNRLRKHQRTLTDATGIVPDQVQFRTHSCDPHLMVALESALIEKHQPPWNSTGFGSNAHGKGRPNQKISDWNMKYGRGIVR